MDLQQYIKSEVYIIIPALWVIGLAIKKSPIHDWLIPYILGIVGIAGAISIMGFSVDSIIQGILCAGFSVYGNQLVKQAKKRN